MPNREFAPRKVRDIMSSPVVTVEDTDGYKLVVAVLRAKRISATPVVSQAGELLGLVSEADLMLKEEGEVPGSLLHPLQHRRQQSKAGSVYAGELMSSPVQTIKPDATVAEAARTMQKAGVKRLVVVEDGRLCGIVSRGDILKIFLRDDADIADETVEGVIRQDMMIDAGAVKVVVRDGIVTISGQLEFKSDINRLHRLVCAVDGVVAVNAGLGFRVDDTVADMSTPMGPMAGFR